MAARSQIRKKGPTQTRRSRPAKKKQIGIFTPSRSVLVKLLWAFLLTVLLAGSLTALVYVIFFRVVIA
jgi:hypothetical protein